VFIGGQITFYRFDFMAQAAADVPDSQLKPMLQALL
jgi:hypothetical protein